jgi:hypothetical protein
MRTFMPTRFVAPTASPSALRGPVPRICSPTSARRPYTTITGREGLEDYPTGHRHRCIPGAIDCVGSLQSPFNPHTSTALAA